MLLFAIAHLNLKIIRGGTKVLDAFMHSTIVTNEPLSAKVIAPMWRFPFTVITYESFVWTKHSQVSSTLYILSGRKWYLSSNCSKRSKNWLTFSLLNPTALENDGQQVALNLKHDIRDVLKNALTSLFQQPQKSKQIICNKFFFILLLAFLKILKSVFTLIKPLLNDENII